MESYNEWHVDLAGIGAAGCRCYQVVTTAMG